MHQTSNSPELHAPAGDYTALRAALDNGCDAVYCGLKELNMRAKSENFDLDDFPYIHKLCRERGVSLHLVLNTIIFDNELSRLEKVVEYTSPYIDAVICWDPAVIDICRKADVPIHISTQASVANSRSALFYRQLGAKRITLARECSLAEIAGIKEQSGVEIEAFVHGAMCVSVSGRCFVSQFFDGKSANRGKCVQPCRREYIVKDKNIPERELEVGNHYLFSARDLCTLPFLDQLVEAGVDACKIEGRGKSPHYVAAVTSCYRQALEAINRKEFTSQLKEKLVTDLRRVYNRDFSAGFYFNRPVSDFTDSAGSKATEKKLYVGVVNNFYAHPSVAEIRVQDHGFKVGDKLLFEGNKTGSITVSALEIRRDKRTIEQAGRGVVTIKTPHQVRRNDKVYLLTTCRT